MSFCLINNKLFADGITYRIPKTQQVKSVTYWKDIIIRELKLNYKGMHALSVSFDGQLLIASRKEAKQVYVYSTTNGSHVTTLHVPSGGLLLDLAWTRRGNIVYTAKDEQSGIVLSSEVVTISLNGNVMARTVSIVTNATTSAMFYQYLSASTDGAIYLTVVKLKSNVTTEHFVYESINEGVTWSVAFKIPGDTHFEIAATKVSTTDPQHDVFWTRATAFMSPKFKLHN